MAAMVRRSSVVVVGVALAAATALAAVAVPGVRARTASCLVTAFGAQPDNDATDDTAAFAAALSACLGQTVRVPAGRYRLDGTVQLGNTSLNPARNRTCDGGKGPWAICPSPPVTVHLFLEHGAELRRLQSHSQQIGPVVSIAQYGCRLSGEQAIVSTENAAPRGVVHLGPSSPYIHGSLQFASISGISIFGPYRCGSTAPGDVCTPNRNFSSTILTNPRWTNTSGYEQCGYGYPDPTFHGSAKLNESVVAASFGRDGVIGLCIDSSEEVTLGACYQNTIRDLNIMGVDVGMFAATQVNGNEIHNLQFIGIGTTSMWFETNSENTIVGGFTGGTFPGSPFPVGDGTTGATFQHAIRGIGSYTNFFVGTQGEPGFGSYYFFDNTSYENVVFGHDNFPHGSTSHDRAFLYLNSGSVATPTGAVTASEIRCHTAQPPDWGLASQTGEAAKDLCKAEASTNDQVAELRGEVAELKVAMARLLHQNERLLAALGE